MPLKERIVPLRPASPWSTNDIKGDKVKRRKFERCWRAAGETIDNEVHINECKAMNDPCFQKRMHYYSIIVDEH